MGGRGQRFKDLGYHEPKPFIDVGGQTMIERRLSNLGLNHNDKIVLIPAFDQMNEYVEKNLRRILDPTGIKYHIEIEIGPRNGMAYGALLAEKYLNLEEPVIITDCDHLVLDDQYIPNSLRFFQSKNAHGGFYCHLSDDPKWSYVSISQDKVNDVIEKQVISNIANTGDYYYKTAHMFFDAVKYMVEKNIRTNGEFYVAPSYKSLIIDGYDIYAYMVNMMVPLGTPKDLEKHLAENKYI